MIYNVHVSLHLLSRGGSLTFSRPIAQPIMISEVMVMMAVGSWTGSDMWAVHMYLYLIMFHLSVCCSVCLCVCNLICFGLLDHMCLVSRSQTVLTLILGGGIMVWCNYNSFASPGAGDANWKTSASKRGVNEQTSGIDNRLYVVCTFLCRFPQHLGMLRSKQPLELH